MKIIKGVTIKQLIEYEAEKDINALDELENYSMEVLIDIVMISNKLNYDTACDYIAKYIKQNTLSGAIIDLFSDIFGEIKSDGKNNVEIKTRSFTQLFMDFYNQIQTVDDNLTFKDFCDMNTLFMYRYCDGIKIRAINNKNQDLQSNYELVGMFGSMLAGKLKECPQIKEDGKLDKKNHLNKQIEQMRELKRLKEQGLINKEV